MKQIDFRYDLLPLKDKLFRLALRIVQDRPEAEDVTQDTLLRVWERREELSQVKSLEAYVLTTGRNLALDRCRKREAQNISLEETTADTPDSALTADRQMEADEKRQRVHDIFNRLPETQRTVMQLRDIEGKATRGNAIGLVKPCLRKKPFSARSSNSHRCRRIWQCGATCSYMKTYRRKKSWTPALTNGFAGWQA